MAKMKTNWGAFLLSLIGALVYLYIVWSVYGSSFFPEGASTGAVIQAILFGIATIGAISLLLITLGSTVMPSKEMSQWAMKANLATGLTLIALSVSIPPVPPTWFWATVIGFILAEIGNAVSMM